jgi:hypothetical protein
MTTPQLNDKLLIDPRAKLLAVLDQAEDYRGIALRAKDVASVGPMSASWSFT